MEVSSLPQSGSGFLPLPRRLLARLPDDRLVEQLRGGNDAAFEVVYDRHHRAILSFCRHMLTQPADAEDAVQQTFVSAYYDLRSNHREMRLKPWLYTIARNRCLSTLRARREQASEIHDIPTVGLSEEVQRRDELRRILADMHELPHDQRAALVLSELGDLSHAEIGDVVGCETSKVKSLVFQARSALIESRDARDASCEEIREQISTLRGGALRRTPIRKHLKSCPGCREFREDVRRQRAAVAVLLPVAPTTGLKGGVLAAVGLGGGGAAVVGGATAGGLGLGGGAAAAGGGTAAKVLTIAALGAATVGGGAAMREVVAGDGGGGGSTESATPPGAMPERDARGRLLDTGGGSGGASGGGVAGAKERGSKGGGEAKAESKGSKGAKGTGGGKEGKGGKGGNGNNSFETHTGVGTKGGRGSNNAGGNGNGNAYGLTGEQPSAAPPVAPVPEAADEPKKDPKKRGNGFGHLEHDELLPGIGGGHDRDP
jgi:RNA polymerase sigma factor (sigma-70 family)